MYNLIDYIKNYSKTTGSFWSYYRDDPNSGAVGNMNYSIKDPTFFDYKMSITGRWQYRKNVEIVVPLKYLSNFWRALDVTLINCEINLILTLSENYAITSKATRDVHPNANPAVAEINNQQVQHSK